MSAPAVITERPAEGVGLIRINRPEARNVLGPRAFVELADAWEAVRQDNGIRVVVLTADTEGQARPVFSAGYDVSGFDGADHDPLLFERTVDAVAQLRPVVIAGDDFGGVENFGSGAQIRVVFERSLDLHLVADEQESQPVVTMARHGSAGEHYPHADVTAHRINRDPRRFHVISPPVGRQAAGAMTSRPL